MDNHPKELKNKPYTISITGTKGKTTISRVLDYLYRRLKKETLLVDTDGYYLNGRKRGSLQDSVDLYGLYTTVCPGRFLYTLKGKKDSVAILETSVGSGSAAGLGYLHHNVGIFTNIFEDHIGVRVSNKQELAEEKAKLIFYKIGFDGTAIFNADDEYVVSQNRKIQRKNRGVKVVPVGFDFSEYDLEKHLAKGESAIQCKDGKIFLHEGNNETEIFDPSEVSWTFDGNYRPSIYNLMFVIATIYSRFGTSKDFYKIISWIKDYKLNNKGGRLVVLNGKKSGVTAIIDYAHEKESLKEIANLAKGLSKNKTIGIVRFSHQRTDEQLIDYAKSISNSFDTIIVYDKIDGKKKVSINRRGSVLKRDVGQVSQMVFDTIKEERGEGNLYRILEENKAINEAFKISEKGDVIVHISDNHKKSYQTFKRKLK
jgi:cyanophycin synthetase